MNKIKQSNWNLLVDMLVQDNGEVPWYSGILYMYSTKLPLYTWDSVGDYTKVFYNSADDIFVVETYMNGNLYDICSADTYLIRRSRYFVNLKVLEHERKLQSSSRI